MYCQIKQSELSKLINQKPIQEITRRFIKQFLIAFCLPIVVAVQSENFIWEFQREFSFISLFPITLELKLHDMNINFFRFGLSVTQIFFKPYQFVHQRKPGRESLYRSLIVVHFSVIVLDGRLQKLCSLEVKLSLA